MGDGRTRDILIPRMLNKKEAASYCGLSVSTFMRRVNDNHTLKPVQISERRIVWDRAKLDKWLDSLQ